jgi:sugar phosphate isomerase/epimerase|tara:strand:- start:419 stop:1258 length:840 start_codon:yes stop_codon:yes gene_type:complete
MQARGGQLPTIALTNWALALEDEPLQGLEFAVRHGFRGMEIGTSELSPENMDSAGRRLIRSLAEANGVALSIHFLYRDIAPASHDKDRRARHFNELNQTLELALDIGAEVVVMHPGPIDCPGVDPTQAPESVRQESIKILTEFLADITPKAQTAGVVVTVENMHHVPGQVIQNYEELLGLVEPLNNPALQITLDMGHADRADGITEAFEVFSPYLRHIHVHDSNGKRDHLEIGLGDLDFSRWSERLRAYPFTMVLESRNNEDPEGNVLRSRELLSQSLG